MKKSNKLPIVLWIIAILFLMTATSCLTHGDIPIGLIILVAAIGLGVAAFLLYKKDTAPKNKAVQIIAIAAAVLFAVFGVFIDTNVTDVSDTSDDPKQTTEQTITTTQTPTTTVKAESPFEYKIVKSESYDIGSAKRQEIRVTASESDINNATEDDIKAAFRCIIDEQIAENQYDAVSVLMYCEGDNTDSAYTVGKCEYALNGEWGDENMQSVNGDYSGFDYKYDIYSAEYRESYRKLFAE